MNIKAYFTSLPLQKNPKKYEQFVKNLDYKKLLAEEPLCVKDQFFNDRALIATDIKKATGNFELHRQIENKYHLREIATAKTDFEKVLQVLHWLTAHTFYSGAQMHKLTDNTVDILQYAFGKSFTNALNCRCKAIAFADCLVAVGIKAYPVCMLSAAFKNCHFTCRAYITELEKWCVFDPSFGCWFSDENGKPIDIFEMRDLFLQGKEPVLQNYNFNGTTNCREVYVNAFLKLCVSNLSTWDDNSMNRRNVKKFPGKKEFNAMLPDVT